MQAVHTKRPGQAVPLDSARFLPLQRAASDRWETLEEELETSVEVRRTGGFTIAETEEQYQELRDKHGWEAAAGIHTEILDGDAARAALPLLGPTVAAATWCDLDGYANPLKVTPAYLDSATRHGGRTVAFAPVRRITRNGDGWRVVAGRGAAERVVDTPVVVDVAGAWLGEIAAMAGITLRMTPVAIQMHATVRSSATMSHLVQHIGEGLSVKQVTAGNLLIGGGWPALSMDLAGRSDASLDSLVGNVALAVRVLPFIRDLRLLRMWAGPLAATPDEMPVIGEVPGAPGFYVAGGTYAFTFAPLWGDAALPDRGEAAAGRRLRPRPRPADGAVEPGRQRPRTGKPPGQKEQAVLTSPRLRPTSEPETLWLTGGHVVDVRSGRIRRNVNVLVAAGRIEKITADAPPPGARIVELGGRYLMPGLISVHTHLSVLYPFSATDESENPGLTALRALSRAQDALVAGVTTIRCVHEQNRADLLVRTAADQGWVAAPRIVGAGRAISTTGGHGKGADCSYADGHDGFLRAARQELDAGADLLKIFITGGIAHQESRSPARR